MNRSETRRQLKLAKQASKKKKPTQSASPVDAKQILSIQQSLDLAVQHHIAGRLPDAKNLYTQILQVDPNQPVALHLLGVIAFLSGEYDGAVELITNALSIHPEYAEAHCNLGLALEKLGRFENAISSFQKAIEIQPDYADAYNNKGALLKQLGRIEEAKSCFVKAVTINPDYAGAQFNLGNTLTALGSYEEAIACYHKALAIRPAHAQTNVSLGLALQYLDRSDEALECFQKAIAAQPNYAEAHSILIFVQDFIPSIDQAAQQAERKRWNDRFIKPLERNMLPHNNNRDPERRLRIGYVSADFRYHSACMGFSPLIIDHDRENFDVICYDATIVPDHMNEVLRVAATHWRPIRNVSDDLLAQTIREDKIDILIDLSGHTQDNRLKGFGYKPAPLQVCGIGNLAPGISTIDYRLTTDLATPPEEEQLYPEKPIYLSSFFGFTPPPDCSSVKPSPCLKNGFITFGFLGRFSKVSDDVLSVWGKILQDVPQSRLLLKYAQLDDPIARQAINQIFSNFGIAEDRMILLGKTSQHEHFEAHNRVDILLDTFPCGGGITTLESIWMGVPVIGMVQRNKVVGRLIEFIGRPLGLEQWIAHSTNEYHDIAVGWAERTEEISQIRQELRQRVMDVYFRFPQDVEKSYRLIWKRWCNGEAPSPLYPDSSQ